MAAEKITRPHVLQAIEAVQTELAKIGIAKEKENKGQGFKFRGIDQVLTVLSGLLAANRVLIAMRAPEHTYERHTFEQRDTKSGGKLYATNITARFVATSLVDGSEYDLGTYSGEGSDSGDKSTSKAHSMAYKYAMFLGLCIPLEGVLDDTDSETPEEAPKKAPSSPAEATKAAKATKAAPKASKATESPTEPAKGTLALGEIEIALAQIAGVGSLDAAEKLAMTLRGLRAHERFNEVKTSLKAKIAELSAAAE